MNIKDWQATATAIEFYLLNTDEMDTLPYWEFPKAYNPSQPGRSYTHDGVKSLVFRKNAMLDGLHHEDLKEPELLKRGKDIWEEQWVKTWISKFKRPCLTEHLNSQVKRWEKHPNLSAPATLHIQPKTLYIHLVAQ